MGPKSMGVALLTAGFVGMVFTIQVRLACSTHTYTLPWGPSLLHHSCTPCCEGSIVCLEEHKNKEAAMQLYTSAHTCAMS